MIAVSPDSAKVSWTGGACRCSVLLKSNSDASQILLAPLRVSFPWSLRHVAYNVPLNSLVLGFKETIKVAE